MDAQYRWRGTVIKCWKRRDREMWQAHYCFWKPGLWPFSRHEICLLSLLRWEIDTGRVDEFGVPDLWEPERGVCPPDQR